MKSPALVRPLYSVAFLLSILLAVVLAGCGGGRHADAHSAGGTSHGVSARHGEAFMPGVVGEVNIAKNGFDPMAILTDFDYGTVSTLPGGQRLREYRITAAVHDVEIVPGIIYQAWTYNGRVPGPTIRATEGDRIRIHFHNGTEHPHSMHFHTVHPAGMDGVYEPVPPGGDFVYEFDAAPFGVHPYHCHVMPLASHISRGLYGAMIIDPRGGTPPRRPGAGHGDGGKRHRLRQRERLLQRQLHSLLL